MLSFFRKLKRNGVENTEATIPPPKPLGPLDELYIVSHVEYGLTFHASKNQPPVFNLDVEPVPLRTVLRRDLSTKSRPLGWCETADARAPRTIVLGENRYKSSLESISINDYRWTVEASQWALKGAVVDDEATLVEQHKTFQWLRFTPASDRAKGFSNPDWKLIDRATDEVHAVFVDRCVNWHGRGDRGELQFRRSYGTEWELGVLVTIGVVIERERSRRWKRGNFAKGMVYQYNAH